jgi:hypothetical protein
MGIRYKTKAKRRKFDEFPKVPIEDDRILGDTRNMGYLCKFRDWHVKTGFYFALLGLTDEQMAEVFDVPLHEFVKWKHEFPTFLEAIKKGKEQADADVVYSLYKVAVGYECASEQLFAVRDKEFDPVTGKLVRETSRIIREPIVKKYPPNVKAAIKWLESRQPGQWSARPDYKQTLTVKHQVELDDLSVEELKLLTKLGVRNQHIQDVPYTNMETFQTTVQKEMKELN